MVVLKKAIVLFFFVFLCLILINCQKKETLIQLKLFGITIAVDKQNRTNRWCGFLFKAKSNIDTTYIKDSTIFYFENGKKKYLKQLPWNTKLKKDKIFYDLTMRTESCLILCDSSFIKQISKQNTRTPFYYNLNNHSINIKKSSNFKLFYQPNFTVDDVIKIVAKDSKEEF